MLVNPYEDFTGVVAKPSRKTDMYAFALVSWEVLSGNVPFGDVRAENVLCSRVHRGHRPDVRAIPAETPAEVVSLITSCWDKDRNARRTAQEAMSILDLALNLATNTQLDVYVSHSKSGRPLLGHCVHFLSQHGFRVWYDKTDVTEMSLDRVRMVRGMVNNCKVVLACVDREYQSREACMFELRLAKKLAPAKVVLTLVMEESPLGWGSDELVNLCEIKTRPYVDVSTVFNDDWSKEEGPDPQVFAEFRRRLLPLVNQLANAGCISSIRPAQS
jgi:hypothetical protein